MKIQQHPLIHIFQARQGDQKIGKKFAQNFGKSSLNIHLAKKMQKYLYKSSTWNSKITTFLTLKTYNKPHFDTTYLGENGINLIKQKVAQNVATSLSPFIFKKKSQWASKSSLIGKNHPIWLLWSSWKIR
jgi:hypothetical protein